MELKQLQHLIAVVEYGSISGAARHLSLAQPAISASIKKLESELNILLLHRRERGVSLTRAGENFIRHAQLIVKQADDARLSMQALEGLEQGEVLIGVPSMLGSYFFPPLLMAFRHRHPALEMHIIDDGTRNIRQLLMDGEIEIGVVADKDLLPELESIRLVREEMVVCMATDHPLAEKKKIEYSDFLAHDLVLFRKGYYHHALIEKISRQAQMKPNVAFTSNLLPLIKAVIRQGYAISPMWKVVIQDGDDIVTRPFTQPFTIDMSLAWRRGSHLSRANQAFRDFVQDELHVRPR
ncbi:LysR family transcriptional regulator [Vibrio mangrovi]|uniref:HTH-type transcriptional regulator CynR n=1 Tax=Vibrio mangrovi TaxID=474394 RepID=A0A1Y6IXB7_9VIBR|nr:LysR family transcriptional regulator [Vibrio mangrovi]MDW6001297.1 LysR family transcriptional regulator [Vibrio mangrovi]SMS00683.1 HTH-type transcriptional regulator CynR [Vibrio mangrovi]